MSALEILEGVRKSKNHFCMFCLRCTCVENLKWIDELIMAIYSKGISTRNTAEIMKKIFQNRYLKSTISAITEATLEEVKRFQERSLDRRYISIFFDGLFFFPRRDTMESEPVIFDTGIRETREYEIPGFYLFAKETHNTYFSVIHESI